jgi:hypothetical protein
MSQYFRALLYMKMRKFVEILMNVLVQVANEMGL